LRNEFKSRKVWLTLADNPEYPQTVEIEVNGKSLDIFEGVSISFDKAGSIHTMQSFPNSSILLPMKIRQYLQIILYVS